MHAANVQEETQLSTHNVERMSMHKGMQHFWLYILCVCVSVHSRMSKMSIVDANGYAGMTVDNTYLQYYIYTYIAQQRMLFCRADSQTPGLNKKAFALSLNLTSLPFLCLPLRLFYLFLVFIFCCSQPEVVECISHFGMAFIAVFVIEKIACDDCVHQCVLCLGKRSCTHFGAWHPRNTHTHESNTHDHTTQLHHRTNSI